MSRIIGLKNIFLHSKNLKNLNLCKKNCFFLQNNSNFLKQNYFLSQIRFSSTEPKTNEKKIEKEEDKLKDEKKIIKEEDKQKDEKKDEKSEKITNDLLEELKKADWYVRKFGRIELNQLESIINKCKKELNVTEAIMLLRCAGSLLVKENKKKRQEMFKKVLELVNKSCNEKNIDLSNTILSLHLDNNISFDPIQQIQQLQQQQLTPNHNTFKILLSQYCNKGEIDKALEILEHMKKNDMTVTMETVHQLLKAFVKKGDTQQVNNIMQEIKQEGLRMGVESYCVLMEGHVENGDLEGVKQIMQEVTNKKLKIPLRNAYDIVVKATLSGHENQMEELISIINPSSFSFSFQQQQQQQQQERRHNRQSLQQRFHDNQDIANTIYNLLSQGKHDAAINFLTFVSKDSVVISNDEKNSLALNYLLTEVIKKGVEVKEVMRMRKKMMEENLLSGDPHPILFLSLKHQDPDYTLSLFSSISGMESFHFKQHFFWPLFSKAAKNKNIQQIYDISKYMIESISDQPLTLTFYNWSLSNLLKLGVNIDEALNKFKELGISKGNRDGLKISYLVSIGDFKQAQQIVNEGGLIMEKLIKSLVKSGLNNNNNNNFKHFIQLIKSISERGNNNLRTNSLFLLAAIKSFSSNQKQDIESLIQLWIDNEMKLDGFMKTPVARELRKRKVENKLIQSLSPLFSSSFSAEFSSPLSEGLSLVGETKKNIIKERKVENKHLKETKELLKKKNYSGLRSYMHLLAEKKDIQNLLLLEKSLNLDSKMKSFILKRIFIAHILTNQGEKFAREKININNINNYINQVVLETIYKHDSQLYELIENYIYSENEALNNLFFIFLQNFYLNNKLLSQAEKLIQLKPILKKKMKIGVFCGKARQSKDEKFIRKLLDLYNDPEEVKVTIPCYNALILIKCDSNNAKEALNIYNEALNKGLTFNDLSIRALQALQSNLNSQKIPLPWKEGELEKRSQKFSSKDFSTDSSSSDSD